MGNYTPDYDAEDISGAVVSGLSQGMIEFSAFVTIVLTLVLLVIGVAIWKKIRG